LKSFVANKVEAEFSRAAGTYALHARVQTAAAEWLAEWLPEERNGRALEAGAGPGIFTRHLLPWSGQLVATDASAAMCEKGHAAWPQIEWRPMQAQAPATGPWDWIFTSSMLQWIDDPTDVFTAWKTTLAPGGRVTGVLFAEESLPELRALMGGWSPVVWRTPEEWSAHLERSGLRVLRTETLRRSFFYASATEFLRSLHGVGATPTRRLSVGALRRLLRDYEKLHGGSDGVKATWTFYRFQAERMG
jgi:SAM-dependent methyltransferase